MITKKISTGLNCPICQKWLKIGDIIRQDNLNKINSHDALLEACKAWMKVESEMLDNHPCPDLLLRAQYRKEAVIFTKAAIALAEKP